MNFGNAAIGRPLKTNRLGGNLAETSGSFRSCSCLAVFERPRKYVKMLKQCPE